jgi:hypothetical protein
MRSRIVVTTAVVAVKRVKRLGLITAGCIVLAFSASEASAQLCARDCDESGWYADSSGSPVWYYGQTTWGFQCTDFGTEECQACPSAFEDCPGNETNLLLTNDEEYWNERYEEYGCCPGDQACYCPDQLQGELIAKAVALADERDFEALAILLSQSDELVYLNLDLGALEARGCDNGVLFSLPLDSAALRALKSHKGNAPSPPAVLVSALLLGLLVASRRVLRILS